MARTSSTTVTIASSGTTSQAVDVGEWLIAGIVTPAALTGITMTFTGALTEGGTYRPLRDSSGTAISVTVSPDDHILIEPQTFAGVSWIKLVSGSTEAAAREITLVLHRREG